MKIITTAIPTKELSTAIAKELRTEKAELAIAALIEKIKEEEDKENDDTGN